MTEALNSYIRKETIANVVINVAVTAAIVWFTKMDGGTILVGGEEGFGIDIIVTAFLLFFIMSFVVMAIQKARVKSGAMAAFSWDAEHRLHRILDRMPKSVWLSALLFAVFAVLIIAPITLGLASVVGLTEISPFDYMIAKALWAGVVVAVMNRIIIQVGLAA